MIRSRLFLIVVIAVILFSTLSCDNNSSDSSFPFQGPSDSDVTDDTTGGTGDTGDDSSTVEESKYYVEPVGDDSCSSCPDQLSSAAKDQISDELSKNSILNAKIDLNVRVTVPQSENPHSDGDTDLWATVIRPSGSEKLPTIVVATPYRREIMMMLYVPLVMSRYNLMVIDIRGTGSSSGKWTSFDLVEQYDIKYVVDKFIPTRVWSDGKVGMIGPSYMGIIQLLTAGLVETDPKTGEPVHLKALFPLVPMADAYRDIVMHGGNCDMLFIPLWLGMVDIMAILPSMLNLGVDGKFTKEDMAQAQAMWPEHLNHIPTTIGWVMDAANLNDGPFYDKKSTMIYWPDEAEGRMGIPRGKQDPVKQAAGFQRRRMVRHLHPRHHQRDTSTA